VFRLLGAYINKPETATKAVSLWSKWLIQQIMAALLGQMAVPLGLVEMLNSMEVELVGAEVETTALKIQLRYPFSLTVMNVHLRSAPVMRDV